VNGRVVVIAGLTALLVAGGIGAYLFTRPPVAEDSATTSAPERPAADDAPAAAPEPASPAGPAPRRPTATAAPEATPAPAPEVAETAPLTATLRIESDVPGADVFIDRKFIGQTPLTVPDLAPGSHQLNVTATGHEGHSETIDVAPGPRDIRVEFLAVRLAASVKVVHKHGIGSCEGTLSATPEGLRYETSNTGDAFTVPLAGVEAFAVDYLKKNLTVRVRNKTYNFTDPDGDADRLFVFHREVEKVRAKMQ
jgi:hypothetical protein